LGPRRAAAHSLPDLRTLYFQNPSGPQDFQQNNAFAIMTEYEICTYERWLGQPELIKKIARAHFLPVREYFASGKWNFVGTPR